MDLYFDSRRLQRWRFVLGCQPHTPKPFPAEGGSADIGGGRNTIEVVAFGGDPVSKPGGLPSLFVPILEDGLSGGLSAFEAAGGVVDGGLVADDLLVEAGDLRRHVGGAALLGVGLQPHPIGGILTPGVAVPPSGAMFGCPLGPLPVCPGFG